jgi:AmmeMemoRadiSam system protein A
MILKDDGKLLINLARESISSAFKGKSIEVPKDVKKRFKDKQGAFVTLKIKKELRGCIGFIEAIYPLYETVARASVAAAFGDPRFPPLSEEELPELKIEVSVLTKPALMKGSHDDYPKKVEIGKHGLIVEMGYFKGLLLPQVFTEYKCTPLKALDMTCDKANLSKGCWKDDKCKVYTFSCEIFNE